MNASCDRVCRLCSSSRGDLLAIFPTTGSDGSGSPVLAAKIEACVAVQINENDDLPTKVCRKCLDNVNNWHIFKKICQRTQTKLQALLKKESDFLEEVKIKNEPLSDEAYDEGVIIDGSYPAYEQNATASNKLQPEGPPILASLGLTPRSDKGLDSEKDEDEEEEEEEEENDGRQLSKVPNIPEVSITVMRPTGETLHARQGIQQLASKDCLVCGRAYRYSHNARRHELTSHSFDRYTNKIIAKKAPSHMQPKLRPNPFNPKARLMPNPINHKLKLMPKAVLPKAVPQKIIPQAKTIIPTISTKAVQPKVIQNNLPYPLRIKALKDLQIKKKEPQILKTLLTSKPEVLVSEPEIMNSGPESPETLISEPEIASFQVETVLSEPEEQEEEEGEEALSKDNQNVYDTVDMESDNEIEIAQQQVHQRKSHEDENDTPDKQSDHDNIEEEKDSENENEKDNDGIDAAEINHDGEFEEAMEGKVDEDDEKEFMESEEKVEDDQEELQEEFQEELQEELQEENEEDEESPPVEIAPVVEINEGVQNNSYNSEVNEEDEEEEVDESREVAATDTPVKELDPDKLYVTKAQRDFIQKYRNVIEQINTKRCLCCDKEYPRRKAVIQHLQKNGQKVPKHTCYNCVFTFTHLGALLSHMRANNCTNLWKIIYNENGITDDLVLEDDRKETKVQYKDIFNARSYACKLCPVKYQLKQFITKHLMDAHEDGQSCVPLTCVHCGSKFKDRSLLKRHTRNGECTIDIACDLCTEKFASMQEFNEHALAVHAGSLDQSDTQSKCVDGRPTDCPICGKKNSTYTNLVRHLRMLHDEDKPHHCQNCDAKYELATELNKHIYLEHTDRALGVQSSEPDMSIVKEEAEEYHYSCTECNAIFETVDAWTDHQVAEHNQVAHHCDQCDKKFLRPSELAEHKNTHLRVKFYPCSVCPNSYSTPQKLSEHVQLAHPGASAYATAESEFFCGICIRSFKSRQAYSNHMRIHSKVPTTNRRPIEPKAFVPLGIGTQMKPMKQFPIIPGGGFVTFKPNSNVPNAPYSCDICGKGFMHKKNIWKHKKVLHADIVGERVDSEENTMHASTEDDEYNNDENGAGLTTPQFNSFNFSQFNNIQQPSETLSFSCEICYKRFPLKSSLWKHKQAKHGITNANAGHSGETQAAPGEGGRSSCTICKITFSDKKSYYRHRKNVHKSTVQMCKICGKPLNSTLELYEHLKAAHARELLGYNANQGANKGPEVQQNDLEADYEGDQDSMDPSTEYQARYPCDTCGKQFVGLLALQNHQCINQVPSQPQTFDCEICHKSYTSIAALKSHRGWHLRSPDGKAAANNSGLWMPQNKVTSKVSKHEVVDVAQLARVTHTAPAAVAAKRRLPPEVEVTVVNPNKKLRSDDSGEADQPYVPAGLDDRYCSLCDKEFTKRAAYQRHMDEVHQPNSVFCPVCNKSFTRKSTLLVHMRKHTEGEAGGASTAAPPEEELFSCDLCGAQYNSNKALRAHRARHHGEDSGDSDDELGGSMSTPAAFAPGEFTCSQCGDGVATPRDLLAHRTMHATPTKFLCHICKVYFSRALDLSAHTRARHSDNEKVFFPCAMCDRFYMNKKSLQRHIETAH